MVTQHNCDVLLGLSRRQYLNACQSHRATLKPAHIGRAVMTTVASWERLIEQAGWGDVSVAELVTDDAREAQPCTAAEVLARLGLEMEET